MSKLSFIGDLTVDTYPKLNSAHLGGSSLTCALWAKKLGAKATILAAVGKDEAGKQYKELFKKESFSLKFLKTRKSLTSSIEIFLDKNGERTWGEWDPGALAKYHLGKRELGFLKTQDAVAMPVYAKTKHLLDELLKIKPSKPLIAIDFDDLSQFHPSATLLGVNSRSELGASKSTKVIEDHLPYIDIVIVGLDMVTDAKIIRKLQSLSCHCEATAGGRGNLSRMRGNKLFVVTLNKNGSIAFQGNKVFRQKADKIKVVNSTGAGDAFLAGFLVEYVKIKNVQKSLLQGTKTATRAISKQLPG